MIGHYNGGRSSVTLGQLDFVGGGPQLSTTELLNELPGEVGGNHDIAITRARLVLIGNEVYNVANLK